jgi:protein-S-isoprenylcysteine O-methyltransferase
MNAIFALSFVAWCCLELWVFLRERLSRTTGASRDRGSVWWIVLWVWAGIYAGFGFHFSGVGTIQEYRLEWFSLGIVLIWLGFGLRVWAILTLGRLFRTWVVIQDEHRVITAGPYRWVRNPAYSGSTLTMLGLGLAMLNWYSTAALLSAILIAYARRIAIEQRELTAHFGAEYEQYVQRTWALLPFIW